MKPTTTEDVPSITECIEYTRTFVPSTMRSQYWKYFGFPSDNSNNILTRQKIVCNLCNAVIAYNKNTSNLRTHLAAKHPELLMELIKCNTPNNTHIDLMSTATRKRRYSKPTMEPIEFFDNVADSFLIKHSNSTNIIQNTSFSGKIEPIMQNISKDVISSGNIEYKEHPFDVIENPVSNDDIDCDDCNDSPSYRLDDLIVQKDRDIILTNNIDSIVDMLVTDLCKISMLTGDGYQQLYGHVDICEINDSLLTRYTEIDGFIRNHLNSVSQTKPFSIGIEMFTNCEQYDILFVYFNYYDAECNELFNVLYKFCVESEFCFSEITNELKMENCACVILNNSNLAYLLDGSDIPQFVCLDTVLTNCLINIFKNADINKSFQEIYKSTQQYLKDDENTMLTPPDVFPPCPWTKLNFLQFVLDKIELSLQLENRDDFKEIKEFCQYISPLKITMETIAEEELPFCTLIRPLIVKLCEEHFAIKNTENKFLKNIQKIIESNFRYSILSSSFLQEAIFFDVRFQRDYINNDEERENIQMLILQRFKSIIHITKLQEPILKVEQYNTKATTRKSGLKDFFNRISNDGNGIGRKKTNTSSPHFKTNVEHEFEKYKVELQIDLEQCPIKWWTNNAYNYPQLSKVANFYLSVPCCVTRLYRTDAAARIDLLNKRYMLREFTEERYLWYLYYNQLYFNKLRPN